MINHRSLDSLRVDKNSLKDRFWSKTKEIQETKCLEWQASLFNNGYGKFSILHSNYTAHRISYYLHFGIDPGECCVLHTCDNRKCVNPNHLWLGSSTDNNRDTVKKGRHKHGDCSGEKCWRSKLKESDVLSIRNDTRTSIEIAKEFGIHEATVSKIKHRKLWKHLT